MRKIASRLIHLLGFREPFSSALYWDNRYRGAGNSGAGSYGRLAEFKADVLNTFVREHDVQRVVELGCGDGNQLTLACYGSYLGLDVSTQAVKMCEDNFPRGNFQFRLSSASAFTYIRSEYQPDLALSLDVLFHLVEDRVFEQYMRDLFSVSSKYVVVYASDGGFDAQGPHVINRRFTPWVAEHAPKWKMFKKTANKFPFDPEDGDNTSFSDFYFFQKNNDVS